LTQLRNEQKRKTFLRHFDVGDLVYRKKSRNVKSRAPGLFDKRSVGNYNPFDTETLYVIASRTAVAQLSGGTNGPLYTYKLREAGDSAGKVLARSYYREELSAARNSQNYAGADNLQVFVSNLF